MKFATSAFKIVVFINAVVHNSVGENDRFTIPDDFLIGVSTSAYQVEGAWNIDGKGENIWDNFVHKNNSSIADKSSGDVACDFYHKYQNDIKIVKDIGFNHFRFSISWARIFPSGYTDNPSIEGIRYYHHILDELDILGIAPFVTIYHWDHPQNLEEMGGWLNETMAYAFADYAKFIFETFGHRVKMFSTINEPYIFCKMGYQDKIFAPAQNMKGVGEYLCVHNMLKAHALAYHIYNSDFRSVQNGQIGIVLPCSQHYSKYQNDTKSSDLAFEFQCGWTAHPIYSETGDYPEIMKKRIEERSKLQGLAESRLPTFSEEWIERIKGSSDYFGLNHYTADLVESLPESEILNWDNDEGLKYSFDSKWIPAQSAWLKVVPRGLRDILKAIKEKYNNPPVYIMESGVSDSNGTEDNLRIVYIYSYMKEMLKALQKDKCNVKAYTYWSLLDSFEWNRGYLDKFGLIEIDFKSENLTRTPKKSVSWLKKILRTRKLTLHN